MNQSLVVLAVAWSYLSCRVADDGRPSQEPNPSGLIRRLGSTRLRHGGAINNIAFVAQRPLLVSTGMDSTLRIWELTRGDEVGRRNFGGKNPVCLDISPVGKCVLSVTQNGAYALKILSYDTEGVVVELPAQENPFACAVFSPDARDLAVVDVDGNLRVWDLDNRRERSRMDRGTGPLRGTGIYALLYAPDGSMILTSEEDRTLRFWDSRSLAGKATLKNDEVVVGVRFSAAGDMLVLGDGAGLVRLWDVKSGKDIGILRSGSRVVSLALSPGGKYLAHGSGDQTIRIREIPGLKEVAIIREHAGCAGILEFSPDGKILASAALDSPSISLWTVPEGTPWLSLPGHSSASWVVGFPGGDSLVSCGPDGQILFWNGTDGSLARSRDQGPGTLACAAWSGGRNIMAVGGKDGTIRLLDVKSGETLRSFPGHEGYVGTLSFSGTGELLASAGRDGLIKLWDMDRSSVNPRVIRSTHESTTLAFCGDARLLSGETDHFIRLYSIKDQEQIGAIGGHRALIMSASATPDGRLVCSGDREGIVIVSDVSSGAELLRLKGHVGPVRSVAFSPSARWIASGGDDRLLRVWEVATGLPVLSLKGHQGAIRSVCFSPRESVMATSSEDTSILLWNLVEAGVNSPNEGSVVSLDRLWEELADPENDRGIRAFWALVRMLEREGERVQPEILEFCQKHLAPPGKDEVGHAFKMLDDNDSERRLEGYRALSLMGVGVEQELRLRLRSNPPLEARARIEELIRDLERPVHGSPGSLRRSRMIHALELARSGGAVGILRRLVATTTSPRERDEAQDAVKRIECSR